MNRTLQAAVGVALVAALGYVLYGWLYSNEPTDFVADWLTARSVIGEGAAHDPLGVLAEHHNIPMFDGITTVHPRTPGAVLLQLPLALIPHGWLTAAAYVFGVGTAALLGATVYRVFQWKPTLITFGAFVFMLGSGGQSFIASSGPDLMLAAALLAAWHGTRTPLLAAIPVVWKLWAWPIIPMLWLSGRKREAYQAAGWVAGFHAVGLLLPDVGLETVTAVAQATEFTALTHNGSLLPIWPVALVLAGLVVWVGRDPIPTGTLVGLLLAPIVWPKYLVALLIGARSGVMLYGLGIIGLIRWTGIGDGPVTSLMLIWAVISFIVGTAAQARQESSVPVPA